MDVLNGESSNYQALLKLRKHISNMSASFRQLKGISHVEAIDILEKQVNQAIIAALNNESTQPYKQYLNNSFSLLKVQFEEDKTFNKVFSGFNIFTNSILTAASAFGVILFGAAVTTGPLGLALLGLGMAVLSALLLTVAVYSIYVDGRYLHDFQLQEIKEGIEFLNTFDDASLSLEPEAESSSILGNA
ncbi:hypothetical protein [Legionella jamestowniensis]|uniref:hypothetical protein n=1 Tax=Legionella jamestowniensis TaxID=455 RepID=UPI001040E3C6|nr:hypothetical protein [Legionella jamestowniensis]